MNCILSRKSETLEEKKTRNRKVDRKWKPEEDRLMVELVKERDALWDVRSPNYKNRDLKIIGWAEVARKTNHSFEGAKNHWNALRSRFFTERKKMETRKNEKGRNPYIPTFYLFKSLQFLCKIEASQTSEAPTNSAIGTEDGVVSEDSVCPENNPPSSNNSFSDSINESELKILAAKTRRQTQSKDSPRNADRTALIGEISDLLKKVKEWEAIPEESNWRRAFVEFMFHEISRYDEPDAHRLKQQILMVCVNFQPKDQFMEYEPAEDCQKLFTQPKSEENF